MKKLPLTNLNKFKKVSWEIPCPSNCETFWLGIYTRHVHRKNRQQEGIKIIWKGNPFGLIYYTDNYILEK